MAASNDKVLDDADRLYAARSAVADAAPGQWRIGVAELARFLTDPDSELTMEGQRELFANPRLRADFQRLKQRMRVIELPALAAASAGDVTSRAFDGGTARIHPSRVEGQVYVVFRFEAVATPPSALLLEDASGRVVKRPLPVPDASGQVVVVLDRSSPSDDAFLQMLAEPTTTGSFLS